MNKIWLIIQREYLTRVKQKSFIVMTLLGPLLMVAITVIPVLITSMGDKADKVIAVIDKTGEFKDALKNTETTHFEFIDNKSITDIKDDFKKSGYYALLLIPDSVTKEKIQLYSYKQPTIDLKSYITNNIEKQIESKNLKLQGIDESVLRSIKAKVNMETIKFKEGGKEEKSSTEMVMAIGFIAAFLIYLFVFVYGAQVMRGVIEEKTSRIVEVIISSVKPFQLMMGKILGIAMVALTQFLLWIILTFTILTVVQTVFMPKNTMKKQIEMSKNMSNVAGNDINKQIDAIEKSDDSVQNIFVYLQNIPWGLMLFAFIFYFLGGYLLYASLFAAIGSAVDNEADTQQFMLPVSLPLILAFVVAQSIIQNPDGQVAFWFSIIPFTSPIVMLIRLPFEVPVWQLALSMTLLVLPFIGTTWVAAKIYRTGILLYGKKVNYKELWKWLKYSD